MSLPDLDGSQRDEHVPVIGCGNETGIDVFAGHQFPKVVIGPAIVVVVALIDGILRQFELVGFDVAHRDHLAIILREKVAQVSSALRAGADGADGDPIAGSHGAVLAQSRAGDNGWEYRRGGGGNRGLAQKVAPCEFVASWRS